MSMNVDEYSCRRQGNGDETKQNEKGGNEKIEQPKSKLIAFSITISHTRETHTHCLVL